MTEMHTCPGCGLEYADEALLTVRAADTIKGQALAAQKAEIERLRADAEIGRQWRENSSLERWFPITAERLAAMEQWARDCRDQVLYPAAQREDAIGKVAECFGQSLAKFHLGSSAALGGKEKS